MAHLGEELISRYVAHSVSEDERLEVLDHLGECDECVELVRVARRQAVAFDALWNTWSAEAHALVRPKQPSWSTKLIKWLLGLFGQNGGRTPANIRWLAPIGWAVAGVALAGVVLFLFFSRSTEPPLGILAMLDDQAGPVKLISGGNVLLPKGQTLPSNLQRQVTELMTNGSVTRQQAVQLALSALRSDQARLAATRQRSTGPQLLSPVMTAVKTNRPSFRWNALSGAQSYKLLIAGERGIVWESDLASQTNFTLAAPAPALKPGQSYSWQIETTVGEELRLSTAAKFHVLEQATLTEVAAVESKFAESSTVLSAVYATYGLYEDLLPQLVRLQSLNPTNSLIQRMIEQVRQESRQP